jgi:hypothetical protein
MAQEKGHVPRVWTETNKTEQGWCKVKTRGGLTALVLNDKREIYMLTNMDPPPAERNFCDNSNRPMKPHSVEWYNWHMGYIENSHRMANSYLMNRHSFRWTMKMSFHFMDLTVLNSWILLSSCGAPSGEKFDWRRWKKSTPRLVGRSSATATNVVWLKSPQNQQWPEKSSTKLCCHICSSHGRRKGKVYECATCDVGLCVVPCFTGYHTRVNL